MSFREPMAHVGMAKIRNWRARHRRGAPDVHRGGRGVPQGLAENNPAWYTRLWRFLAKSAEPAPPESGTREKRAEHSTRFRPLKGKRAKAKRLGKSLKKGW